MNNRFIHFQDISIDDKSSWNDKMILTFDMDWANDEVLHNMLNIINSLDVKVVIFVTHETDLLNDFRKNHNIELGIHPNFNLCFEDKNVSVEEILYEIMRIVPEAKVSRSHCLTTSGRWLGLYRSAGLKFLSNYMMEWQENIQPFNHVNKLIEVPIYLSDDGFIFQNKISKDSIIASSKEIKRISSGIKVFNFHPIHLFINTIDCQHYESYKRSSLKSHQELGVLDLFKGLFNE